MIIGGGDDIGAEIYGGQVLPDVRIDPERDRLELDLLKVALPAGLPILGICRGSQMINVALGGTLHTDIYEVYEQAPKMRTVLPKKRVSITSGTMLDRILRCNPCQVNALHHQSVDRLGRGLRIAAEDEAGIVQAIENERNAFFARGAVASGIAVLETATATAFRRAGRCRSRVIDRDHRDRPGPGELGCAPHLAGKKRDDLGLSRKPQLPLDGRVEDPC